jgi:subtilase family serine protease
MNGRFHGESLRELRIPIGDSHCKHGAGKAALGFLLTLTLPLSIFGQRNLLPQADRIVGLFDPNKLVALKGNIHPKALPENDRGPVAPDLNLDYVTLHLTPTPTQQAELDKLLVELQTPSSPKYRNWLTPEQYADQFGASPGDIEQVVSWLEGQGLTVISTARGRNFVVFKGTAGSVEAALHVEIHKFLVDGEMHFANTTEPSVPAAIETFTIGFSGLDDFRLKPPSRVMTAIPHGLTPTGQHDLSAGDLWTIYDTLPLYSVGATGSGMKLAVIGQADVNLVDIANYQSAVGLTANPPVKLLVGGVDPGITDDSSESDLDLELTAAMAPGAEILFVFSTSVENAVAVAIDQVLAPVISYSYAGCEPDQSPSLVSSAQTLAQQANVQGITWIASSGDYGAAACDPNASIASHGISVMLPASLPEVTAVGGTEFNEGSGTYWGGPSAPFAVSYIPEIAWNDTATPLVNQLEASGGGMSTYFERPSWQSVPGVSSGNARLVPDLALSASPQHDPYFVIVGGSAVFMGGTSASTPVFAGIVLLMAQALGATNGLGNINPGLYSLASEPARVCSTSSLTDACVFHDIVSGNNMVPCVAGVTGCAGGHMGYSAGPGYDMVTGLGSIDAARLVVAFAGLTSGPEIVSVSTAYGGSGIAQNTYIVIKGENMVPSSTSTNGMIWSSAPSFASDLMPTQLGGVSVTVNNKPAFVYFYCSAATDPGCVVDQLNVLTPLDNTTGPVPIVVTNGSVSTPAFTATMQGVAPSFLLFSAAG